MNGKTTGELGAADIAAALEGTACFYDMIGALFLKTLTQDQIDTIAQSDLSGYEGLNDSFDAGINDIVRYLRKRNGGTREELAVDFTGAFIGTKAHNGKNAVPYESVYTSADGLLCQESFHEVRALYRQFSFSKAEDDATPDDHLGYLCAFMAMLLRKAAVQVSVGDIRDAEASLEAAQGFLKHHILSWFEPFASRASLLIETRFYRGVLRMAQGFFEFDNSSYDDTSKALLQFEKVA